LVIDRPQIVGEKEELVLPNRPAEVSAGVVINKMADSRVKERSGIERAVLNKLVYTAMETVGPGFQNHVGDCADAAAKFSFKIAGRHIDGLDGFRRRDQDLKEIVDAFDLIGVALPGLAVHLGLNGTRR